jgi:hypothetical protein
MNIDNYIVDLYIETIEKNEKHHRICKERWNEKNRFVLTNERLIMDNNINWNYIKNYQLGYFLDFPLIKDEKSKELIINFSKVCVSKESPISQGYYFNNEVNVYRFIRIILFSYLNQCYEHFCHTWHHMDSEKIVDQRIGNKVGLEVFHDHELFFIVNSYNRNCENKRHGALYDIINTIKSDRELLGKRTFILSLAEDVGPDKGPEHGFSIPMLPLNTEKMEEYLEAIKNGKNPWR